ncbi:hypothetical protein Asulf_01487 [Archaeoglobus sulfaticallidus PM70-1]|uniref:Uncharacterized protein n=1 Tax=Archaeoglobus sulfaticallidus PM70-1 TaxID=387631 RepID=N0BMI4_9EURY|nr:hypothetical protein [Archaeoglobus sulfaticallidus]AGK61470.1 hypothetical protein Asulf_01487 [Archaeoglobus sulfaticallidus PM70-1]
MVAKQVSKSEHDFGTKKERLSISISPYLKKKLKEMEKSGEFANISEIVNLAIAEFIGKYEAQGKLKPRKSAEEIAEEIEQEKHKPIEEIDAGEEVIR